MKAVSSDPWGFMDSWCVGLRNLSFDGSTLVRRAVLKDTAAGLSASYTRKDLSPEPLSQIRNSLLLLVTVANFDREAFNRLMAKHGGPTLASHEDSEVEARFELFLDDGNTGDGSKTSHDIGMDPSEIEAQKCQEDSNTVQDLQKGEAEGNEDEENKDDDTGGHNNSGNNVDDGKLGVLLASTFFKLSSNRKALVTLRNMLRQIADARKPNSLTNIGFGVTVIVHFTCGEEKRQSQDAFKMWTNLLELRELQATSFTQRKLRREGPKKAAKALPVVLHGDFVLGEGQDHIPDSANQCPGVVVKSIGHFGCHLDDRSDSNCFESMCLYPLAVSMLKLCKRNDIVIPIFMKIMVSQDSYLWERSRMISALGQALEPVLPKPSTVTFYPSVVLEVVYTKSMMLDFARLWSALANSDAVSSLKIKGFHSSLPPRTMKYIFNALYLKPTLSSIKEVSLSEVSITPDTIVLESPVAVQSAGTQCFELKKGTTIYPSAAECMDDIGDGEKVKLSATISKIRILSQQHCSDVVDALIPGYGPCKVWNGDLSPASESVREYSFLPTLSLGCAIKKDAFPKAVEVFGAIGKHVKYLSLGRSDVRGGQVVDLVSPCSKLETLILNRSVNPTAEFLNAYRQSSLRIRELQCISDYPMLLVKELADMSSTLTRYLVRVTCIPVERSVICPNAFATKVVEMLNENQRLMQVKFQVRPFLEDAINLVKEAQGLKVIKQLPLESKLAFLSVLASLSTECGSPAKRQRTVTGSPHPARFAVDNNVAARIFAFAASWVSRDVEIDSKPRWVV